MKLTEKQKAFVKEYLVDLNATQAAIRAGYSEKTARQAGHRMLTNVDIQQAIQAAQKKREQKLEITQESVVQELAKIGFANMADYMKVGPWGDPTLNFSDLTRDQAAALSEVTVEDFTDGRGEDAREVRRVKFKLADKRAALVDIGRHLGMFASKVVVSGKVQLEHGLQGMTDDDLLAIAAGSGAGASDSAPGPG